MKRRLVFLVLCLLAGAVINVLVAWGFALFGTDQFRWNPWSERLRHLTEPHFYKADPRFDYLHSDLIMHSEIERVGRVEVRSVRMGPRAEQMGVHVVRAGWPLLSLQRVQIEFAELPNRESGASADQQSQPLALPTVMPGQRNKLILPYDPLWFGFAVNSLLYSTLICSAVFGVPLARAQLRRRRGRCHRCGYAVEGLPTCPECGAPTHPRKAAE